MTGNPVKADRKRPRRTWLRVVSVTVLVVLACGEGHATPECGSGQFVLAAPVLVGGRSKKEDTIALAAIELRGAEVAIPGLCDLAPATITPVPRKGASAGDRGARLAVSWVRCGGSEKVRLGAVLGPGCDRLKGHISWRAGTALEGPRRSKRFSASLAAQPATTTTSVEAGGTTTTSTTATTVPEVGDRCGGFAGFLCPEGSFCELPPGHCCCDFFGTCVKAEQFCTAQYAPVCGCDRHTYPNDCARRGAGESLAHVGACGP